MFLCAARYFGRHMFSPREEAEKKGGEEAFSFPSFFPLPFLGLTRPKKCEKKKLGKEKKEKDPFVGKWFRLAVGLSCVLSFFSCSSCIGGRENKFTCTRKFFSFFGLFQILKCLQVNYVRIPIIKQH